MQNLLNNKKKHKYLIKIEKTCFDIIKVCTIRDKLFAKTAILIKLFLSCNIEICKSFCKLESINIYLY